MSLLYQSIAKHSQCFQKLTGLSMNEFTEMVEKVGVMPASLPLSKLRNISIKTHAFSPFFEISAILYLLSEA